MYKIIFKPHEWLSLYYSVLVVLFVWVEPTPIANLPERLREETGVWWRIINVTTNSRPLILTAEC